MAEQWLSIVEYARTFGISDMTIRRRIRTGRLQAYLRDGKYYLPVDVDPATGEPVKQGLKPQLNAQPANALKAQSINPMKSHPSAERTLPKVHHAPNRAVNLPNPPSPVNQEIKNPRQEARVLSYAPQYNQIPGRIVASVANEHGVSVEAQALLDYCNSSLATVKDIEKHLEERYLAKLETAQEQIKSRNMEIAKLSQQIEDLQLLVQILERKRA